MITHRIFDVDSETIPGVTYEVTHSMATNAWTCTCPARYQRPCKHVRAARLKASVCEPDRTIHVSDPTPTPTNLVTLRIPTDLINAMAIVATAKRTYASASGEYDPTTKVLVLTFENEGR